MTQFLPPLITSLDQLAVLDVLLEHRFLIGSFQKGKRRWIYISDGQCKETGLTKEYFYNMEMNTGQSAAMEEFQEEVYQKVQVGREVFAKVKTVHPGGVPRNLLQIFRPLRMKLQDWEEEEVFAFGEVKDADVTEDPVIKRERDRMAMAAELLQHSETITMMFDAETEELEYGNQKMSKLYEISSDGTEGVLKLKNLGDIYDHIQWEDTQQFEDISAAVKALKLGSEMVELDCRLSFAHRGQVREEIWHQFHFIPALSPVTSKPVVIVTQSDITKLQQQSTQLMEASRQQEAFTSAVSHELRTPLNGIIGLSESLIQNPDCTEKMLKTLKLVKSSGMRLAALVNDILDAASAKRGRFVIKREMVLLREVSDNCCEMLQSICPRNVKLVNRVDEENTLSHIEGDSSRINQILTNLLSNAIKFTERGSITIQSRLLSHEEVLVEVVDTGCGIPADKWEQVWCPFKQVDMSTTRKYGGTGLGLSLVKELVEAHNGRVGVESRTAGDDRGSTFFFVLPVRQPKGDDSSDKAERPILRHSDLTAGVLTRAASVAGSVSIGRTVSQGAGQSFSRSSVASKHSSPDPPRSRASPELIASGSAPLSAEQRATRQIENMKQAGSDAIETSKPQHKPPPISLDADPATVGAAAAVRRASIEIDKMKDDARNVMQMISPTQDVQVNGGMYRPRTPEGDAPRLKHHSEMYGTFEILSVDDHVVNHIVVENSLTPKGYTVTTCMSGPEALELLETRGYLPDLILLDCMMPHVACTPPIHSSRFRVCACPQPLMSHVRHSKELTMPSQMSGYEMCEKLREQYPCNTLPVIMVSAKNQEDDIVKGLQAGCNDYISKPYGSMELNARIDVQFKLRYLWHMEVSRALSTRDAILHPPASMPGPKSPSGEEGLLAMHQEVTVLVCDIYDMLYYVRALPAQEVAVLVNALYDRFDAVAHQYNLTRIIDDSYMMVLEDKTMQPSAQASKMLNVAQLLLAEAAQVRIMVKDKEETPTVRIGMARGIAHSGVVGMKMTSYSYFGQAVRDAVKVTVKTPAGCVVMSEALMMELADTDGVTQYARQRGGEMMYIAKLGRYADALQEVSTANGQPADVESDLGVDAMNPLSHLRAFLRLSNDADAMQRATSAGSDSDQCKRCWELQSKLEMVENRCTCGACFGQPEAKMVKARGRRGSHSMVGDLSIVPPSPHPMSDRGSPRGSVKGSVEADAGSSSSQYLDLVRSSSVASNLKLSASRQITCYECEDLKNKLEEREYELKRCKEDLRKRTEESYKNEMSTPHHGAQNHNLGRAPTSEAQEVEILSVDDDPVNQMVVENLLEPLGYKVHACMNGIEALEYLRTCSRLPNLVLLDVMMPQMNGYECCQQIRQTYNRMALPVIMVSAKSQVESVVEGLEAGCNDYVSKPFNRVELLARISTQLRVRDASRAEVEMAKTNKLLNRLLPEHIILQLRQNQTMIFEEHRDTTVLCCRIIGFGELVASLPSMELFSIFSRMVDTFVELGERHGCALASIGGDTVVMVVGHDGRVSSEDHAACAIRMSMDMLRAVKDITFPRNPEKHVQIRVGLHSGTAYAGVLGSRNPRYEFIGDSLIIAKTMEEEGYAMNIRITQQTALMLGDQWELHPAGKCRVPGQGTVESFLLKDTCCEWRSALDLMAMDTTRLGSGASSDMHMHDASASFARRMSQGGLARLESVREVDSERSSPVQPAAPGSSRGLGVRSSSGASLRGDSGIVRGDSGMRGDISSQGLTKEDVADVVKGLLGGIAPHLQASGNSSSAVGSILSPEVGRSDHLGSGRLERASTGGRGSQDGECELCAEKEDVIREKETQLAEAMQAIDTLKTENTKLINACSGLADHSRMVSAGGGHPEQPQRYPYHEDAAGRYNDYHSPERGEYYSPQRGPMGYPGQGMHMGGGMGPRMPPRNRAENMLAGMYISAQERILSTLMSSVLDVEQTASPMMPSRMGQPHMDSMGTPGQSWGPSPMQSEDYGAPWAAHPPHVPHDWPRHDSGAAATGRTARPPGGQGSWRGPPAPEPRGYGGDARGYGSSRGPVLSDNRGYPQDYRGYPPDARPHYDAAGGAQGSHSRPGAAGPQATPPFQTGPRMHEEVQD